MKADVVLSFEAAAWPALLLDTDCRVLRANPVAMKVFGAAISSATPQLSAIWPAENGMTPEQFFTHWQQTTPPTVDLKFHRCGQNRHIHCAICRLMDERQSRFLLQLLAFIDLVLTPAKKFLGHTQKID